MLIERQADPFLRVLETEAPDTPFQNALLSLIEASVNQQLQRPELSRLLDFVERQAAFADLAQSAVERVERVLVQLLERSDAPAVEDRVQDAQEVLNLIRALTDVAGERGEKHPDRLVERIHRAVCGYFGIAIPTA